MAGRGKKKQKTIHHTLAAPVKGGRGHWTLVQFQWERKKRGGKRKPRTLLSKKKKERKKKKEWRGFSFLPTAGLWGNASRQWNFGRGEKKKGEEIPVLLLGGKKEKKTSSRHGGECNSWAPKKKGKGGKGFSREWKRKLPVPPQAGRSKVKCYSGEGARKAVNGLLSLTPEKVGKALKPGSPLLF